MTRRLPPNWRACEPLVHEKSSVKLLTGTWKMLERENDCAGSTPASVTSACCEMPSFCPPCRVNPQRNVFTLFGARTAVYPAANPRLLFRDVLEDGWPGNCGAPPWLSLCRLPRQKTMCRPSDVML